MREDTRGRMRAAAHLISTGRAAMTGDLAGTTMLAFSRARDRHVRDLTAGNSRAGLVALSLVAIQAVDVACEVTGADPDQVWTAVRARLEIEE